MESNRWRPGLSKIGESSGFFQKPVVSLLFIVFYISRVGKLGEGWVGQENIWLEIGSDIRVRGHFGRYRMTESPIISCLARLAQ